MEYTQGEVGRVFYARFDHGDDILKGLTRIVEKEQLRCGWFQLFGGLLAADVVTGPEQPVMPPTPVWKQIADTREVLAVGSVFFDGDTPLIHLHAAMGHHGETLTGCVRKQTEVYLLIEAVVYELKGMDITRPWFKKGGFNRPELNRES